MNVKELAAAKAVELVQDEMVVGLGTGTTATWAIRQLGEKVKNGLRIKAIATSKNSDALARGLGIPMTDFAQNPVIDLAIDGADEVDAELNLIKGGGGSLVREKVVASASKQFIVIVDESKLVNTLGKFPLPVEVITFGWENASKKLQGFGCTPVLRLVDNQTFITDNGNYILDCHFEKIPDPTTLYKDLKMILGVVDAGLFLKMAHKVIVASADGTVRIL